MEDVKDFTVVLRKARKTAAKAGYSGLPLFNTRDYFIEDVRQHFQQCSRMSRLSRDVLTEARPLLLSIMDAMDTMSRDTSAAWQTMDEQTVMAEFARYRVLNRLTKKKMLDTHFYRPQRAKIARYLRLFSEFEACTDRQMRVMESYFYIGTPEQESTNNYKPVGAHLQSWGRIVTWPIAHINLRELSLQHHFKFAGWSARDGGSGLTNEQMEICQWLNRQRKNIKKYLFLPAQASSMCNMQLARVKASRAKPSTPSKPRLTVSRICRDSRPALVASDDVWLRLTAQLGLQ